MNQAVRYIAVFGGSMVLLLVVALGLAFLRPDLFSPPRPPASVETPVPGADAATVIGPAPVPTVQPAADTAQTQPVRRSTPAAPDSASSLWKELQNTRRELLQLNAQLDAERRQADSLRSLRSAAAKLINAMNAEDAARVLGNVTDQEARDILMMISTRHAGKILSALDPGRAATILR